MPSTYTPGGIELIGDGEQSGNWGGTTNTNLQILDRMISQAGTITLSGTTHTLTISDGTLSDGQYGVLVFGGSPSGTNTVTISPNDAQRSYIVKNDSGESVVLTQGSGGNVTIADGRGAVVYCDGAGSGAEVVDLTAAFISTLATLGVTASASELNTLDGITATTAELNILDGVTATTAELNILDGVTATTAELNILDGVTATAAEINQLDADSTGALKVPTGTVAQRPTPAQGQIRFNSDDTTFEGYDGTAWGEIGGAGGGLFKGENGEVGSSAGDIFRINEQELNTNVTIDADENASATGPLAIASGVTLTVTSGGNLSIV
jgi:hypothetical protein